MPQNAIGNFTVSVETALAIGTTSLPNAVQNQTYSLTLSASGGTSPYTWSLGSGSGPLPAGLTLSTTGIISGTPTVTGSFPIVVQVSDTNGQVATASFTLVVAAPLSISSPVNLPLGVVGKPYSFTFAATGGIPPYSWGFNGGNPPAGLALATNGVLSGTPTLAISNTGFQVKVVDSGS